MATATLGRLRCATIVARDVDATAAQYTAALDYGVLERGTISTSLAAAWGAPRVSGARFVTLGPRSGADTVLRFVERPDAPIYEPYSCYGWNAIELTVQDCDDATRLLVRHGFKLAGSPEDLGFSAGALRAAQLHGPCGEILYLTQVKRALEGFQLPAAACPIDRMFIAILTGSSAVTGFAAYAQRFANASFGPFETPIPVIAAFQGLDTSHTYRIGTLELAPEHYLEFDDAPAHVAARPCDEGFLPPGIAMISVEVHASTCVSAPRRRDGGSYEAKEVRRIAGAFGEWMELLQDCVARPSTASIAASIGLPSM